MSRKEFTMATFSFMKFDLPNTAQKLHLIFPSFFNKLQPLLVVGSTTVANVRKFPLFELIAIRLWFGSFSCRHYSDCFLLLHKRQSGTAVKPRTSSTRRWTYFIGQPSTREMGRGMCIPCCLMYDFIRIERHGSWFFLLLVSSTSSLLFAVPRM